MLSDYYTPTELSYLFLICVCVRFLIPILIYKYAVNSSAAYALILMSLTFILYRMVTTSTPWWYREFHIMSLLLISYAVYINDSKLLLILMLTDVLFGVFTAIAKNPFTSVNGV